MIIRDTRYVSKSYFYNRGELIITSNALLNDIEWIAELDAASITNLQLTSNPLLSYCSIASICQHLSEGGSSIVQENLIGCNSAEVIIEQCNNVVSVERIHASRFKVVSNLVKDQLQVKKTLSDSFSIYNAVGELVLTSNRSGNLSMSHFTLGMYFIKVHGKDMSIRLVKH